MNSTQIYGKFTISRCAGRHKQNKKKENVPLVWLSMRCKVLTSSKASVDKIFVMSRTGIGKRTCKEDKKWRKKTLN